MTPEAKIKLLEELFEVDSGTITPEVTLDSLNWDSMASLSLIVLVNEKFGKTLNQPELKSFKTIRDILSAME